MWFHARAFNPADQTVLETRFEALDEQDARSQLQARRLSPISLRPVRRWRGAAANQSLDLGLFAQELHTLVQAGLVVVESLEALVEKEQHPAAKAVVQRLLKALRAGQRLSSAMRSQGEQFPPLFVGLVEAAENTGDLADALERFVAYQGRMQAIRQRVISAAIYPALLLTVGGAVALFLMGWVVPRFAAVYEGAGRALPWASMMLLRWGQFAAAHAWPLAAATLAVVAWLALGLRNMARRQAWAGMLAWLPGAARWVELMALSRLYLTLALLLRGGLPVQTALGLAASALPQDLQQRVDQVQRQISHGWPLSQSLEAAALATPIALRFVRAGERSGQVADMLHRAALYHEAETARGVERFSKTFEPLLMVTIGAVVGLIVLLLYMPIFDLAGTLQ